MSMNISEYKINLGRLKASVFGHYGRIAKKAGVTVPTVSQVLNGEWVNMDVLKAAKQVQKELIKEQEKLNKLIS